MTKATDQGSSDIRQEAAPSGDLNAEKACDGGRTIEYGYFRECIECGTRIRHDLIEHQFFGFQNCAQRSQPVNGPAIRRGSDEKNDT